MKTSQRLVHMMPLIPAMLIAGSLLCPNSHAVQTETSQDTAVTEKVTRIHLKNRILVQDCGGAEFETGGILLYVEDLRPSRYIRSDGESRNAGKRGTNPAEGGRPKDIFEMGSNKAQRRQVVDDRSHARGYLAQNEEGASQARERWKNLSPEQKRQYRERLKRWKQLTPEQKAKIKNRYERFKNLPPEKQALVRENWRRYKRLDEGQRRVIRQKYKRWKNLSEAQKQQIRERRSRYKKMTPEQRRRLQENRKRWQKLSPEKKRQLRERNRKRRLQNQDGPQRYNQNRRRPQGARRRN